MDAGLNFRRRSSFDRYPHGFSGGQAQRMGNRPGRFGCRSPKLIVLDETDLGSGRLGGQAQVLIFLDGLRIASAYLCVHQPRSFGTSKASATGRGDVFRPYRRGRSRRAPCFPPAAAIPYTPLLVQSAPAARRKALVSERTPNTGTGPNPYNPPPAAPSMPVAHRGTECVYREDPRSLKRSAGDHNTTGCGFHPHERAIGRMADMSESSKIAPVVPPTAQVSAASRRDCRHDPDRIMEPEP